MMENYKIHYERKVSPEITFERIVEAEDEDSAIDLVWKYIKQSFPRDCKSMWYFERIKT